MDGPLAASSDPPAKNRGVASWWRGVKEIGQRATVKISQLPAATTPLLSSSELPVVVQNAVDKQVPALQVVATGMPLSLVVPTNDHQLQISLACNLHPSKFFPTCDIRHRHLRPLASKAIRAVKPGILGPRYVSERAHQSIGVSRPR